MRRRVIALGLLLSMLLACMALNMPAVADQWDGYTHGEVISSRLTLRDAPNTSASSVTSLHNGDLFVILGEQGSWYNAQFTDSQGRVFTGWLQKVYTVAWPVHITLRTSNVSCYAYPDGRAPLVGSVSKYTRLTVIAEYGNFYVVNLREASAFIAKDTPVWTDEQIGAMRVNASQGSIARKTTARTGAGKDWDSVATLNAGTSVTIIGMENGWYIIEYVVDKLIVPAYVPMEDVTTGLG